MPYYENPGMLRLHLETWASYPKALRDRFRFIIVDDASPNGPAEPVIRENPIDAEVWLFRVEVDKAWAWDHARNVAMHYMPSGWALLTDIDHCLPVESAQALVDAKLNRKCYYIPHRRRAVDGQPYKVHPNSFVIHRDLFWQAGGYDEQFIGYYGKDAAWRRQLAAVGKRVELPQVELVLYGREVIPDASTTTYTRKEGQYYTCAHPEVRARLHTTHIHKPTRHLTLPHHRVL